MKIALVGAELEENLGLRYIASALERAAHQVEVISFSSETDCAGATERVIAFRPRIVGLSMVFTGRAREFCRLARSLREQGFEGHVIAGGHFASLSCEAILADIPEIDSIALGEGERTMCDLAASIDDLGCVPGLCYRGRDGTVMTTEQVPEAQDLDTLPYPKRGTFHTYFDRPIASVLSSRGCWRSCAFCSIDAWYRRVGGRRFRVRSLEGLVDELALLYHERGVRIFNFQDDNFFLPDPGAATRRFEELAQRLDSRGVTGIAIAVKARPDSITPEAVAALDRLGLFRVFLGVENASENGLRNLDRRQTLSQILNALRVLNDLDVHVAYNLLMFEPDTTLEDVLVNLRFMERHLDNPANFCRAECYAGTGLERKLRAEGRLLGDCWGYDYRLEDPRAEAFHQIANLAFFDRNFNNNGLHYFNMQVDFYLQLLRRFFPEVVTETLRGCCKSFIKETNLDTFRHLCHVFDFVKESDPHDSTGNRHFAEEMRRQVDATGLTLRYQGELLVDQLAAAQAGRAVRPGSRHLGRVAHGPVLDDQSTGYRAGEGARFLGAGLSADRGILGPLPSPIPYPVLKDRLALAGEDEW
jgi:radical SAM superfamily enzyme YgiQ (UPF0313 family)